MTHIKINDVSPRIRYIADGTQTVFTYPFVIFKASDIEVYIDTELQNSGYTVAGVGESLGGSVEFSEAPPLGKVVTLYRNLPIDRQSDFQDGGPFRAQVINDELDYQVALIQQMNEKFDRCLSVGITEEINVKNIIPDIFAARDVCANVEEKAQEMIQTGETLQEIVSEWQEEKVQMSADISTLVENKITTDYSNADFVPPVKPQVSDVSAVGYVAGINVLAGAAYFTVPEGGTWFCYVYNNTTTQTLNGAPDIRIVAGGTTISLMGSGYLYGFVWRIA